MKRRAFLLAVCALPLTQPAAAQPNVANLKAAKTLGIILPQSFLLRADRMIE